GELILVAGRHLQLAVTPHRLNQAATRRVARHKDRPAVAALERASPGRQLQARPLFLLSVTWAAAIDQDRPDFRLEERMGGLGARGRSQRAKAQSHSAADQCPAHRESSRRISHGKYPTWYPLAAPSRRQSARPQA